MHHSVIVEYLSISILTGHTIGRVLLVCNNRELWFLLVWNTEWWLCVMGMSSKTLGICSQCSPFISALCGKSEELCLDVFFIAVVIYAILCVCKVMHMCDDCAWMSYSQLCTNAKCESGQFHTVHNYDSVLKKLHFFFASSSNCCSVNVKSSNSVFEKIHTEDTPHHL